MPTYGQSATIDAPAWWLCWVRICSEKYGVDPNFCLAVAECESSDQHHQFRFGKIGRKGYWGPFGIAPCFLKKYAINDPWTNTVVGIRALARHLKKCHGKPWEALQKYNTEPAGFDAYYRRVCWLERRNRREGVFK